MAHKPHQKIVLDPVLQKELKRVVVTHIRPDTDAWLCIWAVSKYMLLQDDESELKIEFVRAGEQMPPKAMQAYVRQGYSVLHVDTGLGRFDQHGKELGRTSSFAMLATALDIQHEPDIVHLLELANATDSAEALDPTSIHFLFKSLPSYYYDMTTKESDWGKVLDVVTTVLDSMAGQWRAHAKSKAKFDPSVIQKTASGKNIAVLPGKASQREAAFGAGADIVLFTEPQKAGGSYIMVQAHRNAEAVDVRLNKAIAELRRREIERRGQTVNDHDYTAIGHVEGAPGWYLHDSGKLFACGTRAHPLSPHEMTRLKVAEIVAVCIENL
jgi:hypothetical protein